MKEVILYRMLGSEKVKWRFLVDDDDVIQHDGPMVNDALQLRTSGEIPREKAYIPVGIEDPVEAATPHAPLITDGNKVTDAGLQMLHQRGIKFEQKPDGTVLVLEVPKKEVAISAFLDSEDCPKEVPNCSTLKAQMQSEIESAGGINCPGCEKNKIRNKYRQILSSMLSDLT